MNNAEYSFLEKTIHTLTAYEYFEIDADISLSELLTKIKSLETTIKSDAYRPVDIHQHSETKGKFYIVVDHRGFGIRTVSCWGKIEVIENSIIIQIYIQFSIFSYLKQLFSASVVLYFIHVLSIQLPENYASTMIFIGVVILFIFYFLQELRKSDKKAILAALSTVLGKEIKNKSL